MNTLAAQERQKRYADQHRREEKLCVGEKVWLSTEHLRMSEGQARKLSKRWIGPYPIESVVSSVADRLKLPRRMNQIHPVFHVSRLKKAIEDPERPLEMSQPGPIHEFGNGSIYYIAEEIVGKKVVRGRTMYKVKWKDWPP